MTSPCADSGIGSGVLMHIPVLIKVRWCGDVVSTGGFRKDVDVTLIPVAIVEVVVVVVALGFSGWGAITGSIKMALHLDPGIRINIVITTIRM